MGKRKESAADSTSLNSENNGTAKRIKMIEKPENLGINGWDFMFRAMLSVKPDSLPSNLSALYTAIVSSLPKNDEPLDTKLYQRLQGNLKLFKAVKDVPGLRFENGELTLEAGHSISLFGH